MKPDESLKCFDPTHYSEVSKVSSNNIAKSVSLGINILHKIDDLINEYQIQCLGIGTHVKINRRDLFAMFGGYDKFIGDSLMLITNINEELTENEYFIRKFSTLIFGDRVNNVELKQIYTIENYLRWTFEYFDTDFSYEIGIEFPRYEFQYNLTDQSYKIMIEISDDYYDGGYDVFSIKETLDKYFAGTANPIKFGEDFYIDFHKLFEEDPDEKRYRRI